MADYAQLGDVRLWYDKIGAGEPLVILHPGGVDARAFAPNIAALASHFTVFTPEQRAHGHTPDVDGPLSYEVMAQDTMAFLETVVGGPSHLLGVSDGATVALLAALGRPDLVRRLVHIAGVFHRDGWLPGVLDHEEEAAEFFAPGYGEVSPDGLAHHTIVAAKLARMHAEGPTLTAADLGKVRSRTLVMFGDDDEVSAQHIIELYRNVPDAELAIVPGTSHGLLWEKSDLCDRIIVDFLTTEPVQTLAPMRRANPMTVAAGDPPSSTLYDAVERRDIELARSLIEAGAATDDDAFYHACEQSNTAFLDLLYAPGFDGMVNHKLDFEDAAGLQWFLDRGVDVNKHRCLHHAICRGRGLRILTMLLDAGADVNLPWDRWDDGRRPLALAARCGHLAAYELLSARSATAELDPVDSAVLAVARGESVALPRARPPSLGNPETDDYGWILGQFALLGRIDVVRALLDGGMDVDTRGWSNFTPLDQAAMHGRTETVRLLIERGADLTDCAFDADGPTPLDSAVWGVQNNRADDGDYPGTVGALLAAGAPTRHTPPTGDADVDALLTVTGR